ncbi:unnamed protein product [Lactuca virosa]|uniref:Leucine-rich repeat-containing N-terminal plant-type domain-containing protein n=1 Tax=Lactuca virosa TaxID=75947 RepID=A0AAU9LZ41_9ASTR|nr:unnamed protein product [Lactuca virosa]
MAKRELSSTLKNLKHLKLLDSFLVNSISYMDAMWLEALENAFGYNPGIKCDCNFPNSHPSNHQKGYWNGCCGSNPRRTLDFDLPYKSSVGPKLFDRSFGINALSGQVPRELGQLTDLISLSLSTNSFTGSLPYEVGNLRRLQELDPTNYKERCVKRIVAMEGDYISNVGGVVKVPKGHCWVEDSIGFDSWKGYSHCLTFLMHREVMQEYVGAMQDEHVSGLQLKGNKVLTN